MSGFSDLPANARLAFLRALDSVGADSAAYGNGAIFVSIARGQTQATRDLAAAHGLDPVPGSSYYFPIGSDNPPERLRWDGPYPGSRGYWYREAYRPRA